MNKLTGLRAGLLTLSLLTGGCNGIEREPVPTPTPDYALSVAQACLGFLNDVREQGWLTLQATPRDEAIILNTCTTELPKIIWENQSWPTEDTAFRAGQRIVGLSDRNGARIDDWRGHDLSQLLADNILKIKR